VPVTYYRWVRRWLMFVCVLPAMGAGAQVTPPEPEPIASELAEGIALAKAGDFDGAVASFLAARATSPSADVECKLGLALTRLEQWGRAYYHLSLCVKHTYPTPKWAQLRKDEIADECRRQGYARVNLNPSEADATLSFASWDGEALQLRELWLAPGTYVVEAVKKGFVSSRQTIEVPSGATRTVAINLPLQPLPTPSETDIAGMVTAPPSINGGARRWWISTGVAGAVMISAAGVAVFSNGRASSAEDESARAGDSRSFFEDPANCIGLSFEACETSRVKQHSDAASSIPRYNLITAISIGTSVAALSAGSYFLYRALKEPESSERPAISLTVTEGHMAGSMSWSF
jgi:hypothetical protein